MKNQLLQSLETQFAEYVARKRKKFDLKKLGIHSDLRELHGTMLQTAVWCELLQIPYGKTLTYSELAQKVGNPKAVRAVASAAAKNPLYILIPCHRVLPKQVKKQGKQGETRVGDIKAKVNDRPINIGNYALGREMKKILLELEGVDL